MILHLLKAVEYDRVLSNHQRNIEKKIKYNETSRII